MTSTDDPDRIRAEIERTQAELSRDVDAFTDKVSPGRIVERRVDRVRGAAGRWRDNVMGSPYDDRDHGGLGRVAGSVGDSASSASSTVVDAAHAAPQAAVRGTRGNPLAAGLIAFGAGMLVSSLLPASRQEQQLAQQAKDRAGELGRPVADAARQAATEMRDELQQPAQDAVQAVRGTATEAGRTVAEDGRSAAQDVRSQAGNSASAVGGSQG